MEGPEVALASSEEFLFPLVVKTLRAESSEHNPLRIPDDNDGSSPLENFSRESRSNGSDEIGDGLRSKTRPVNFRIINALPLLDLEEIRELLGNLKRGELVDGFLLWQIDRC